MVWVIRLVEVVRVVDVVSMAEVVKVVWDQNVPRTPTLPSS